MTVSSNYSSYASYGYSSSSAPQMSKPSFEEIAQNMLSSMDSDGDGSVSSTEFGAAASGSSSAGDIFSLLDTDSSGSMSTEELVAALKNMKPPEPPQGQGNMPPPPGDMGSMPPPPSPTQGASGSDASQLFSALDTNQDGSISQEELSALFEDSNSASSQTEGQTARQGNDWLQKLLSYYGSNDTAENSSASSLSLSA